MDELDQCSRRPLLIATALGATPAQAQPPSAPAETRAAALAQAKAEKAKTVHVYEPNKAEKWLDRAENLLLTGGLHLHPFFDSAYAGGGFTLGAGYRRFVSPYNTVDVRGSITFSGYKRIEAEFLAPRLFNRRGVLSVIGGWREATQVGFYGIGTAQTSSDDRANYSFTQPYVSGRIEVWPTRRLFVVGGGLEYSQWDQGPGSGSAPSVEEIYTPETLPGLGAKPTYLHAEGSAALDWRTSAGYSRRGGAYGVTVHDFADHDSAFGFRRVDYDAIQHIPLLRDAWVLSLHGRHRDDLHRRRRTDSLLHAPGARRRLDAARLFELAVPRQAQPADAGGMARAGESLSRHGGVLRRRESDGAPSRHQLRGTQERLRSWLPVARTGRDTAAHRVGEKQRGPRPRVLVEGRVLRKPHHAHTSHRSAPADPDRPARRHLGRHRVDAGPPLLRRRPDRSRSGHRGCLESPAVGHRTLLRPHRQSLRHRRTHAVEHARAERQHHRRGARLELVHQSRRERRAARTRLLRGPNVGPPPAPEKWVIIREKASGYAPGFTARDANGETWFVSFDPPSNPKGATAAVVDRQPAVLGARLQPGRDVPDAHRSGAAGDRREGDRPPALGRQNAVHEGRPRRRARARGPELPTAPTKPRRPGCCPGKILGPFRYEGTRPDDPNDIVPHEHRRELRALRVFGAWTNLTDLKAGNTLDTLVTENGRSVVKHYLQDVGSTFGMGANGPHDWDEGWEYFYQGNTTRRRLLSFGFALSPWQTAPYTIYDSVGRFEGDRFDPTTWKPHTATTAYIEMRPDDAFWAARRVMAFTDDLIRAIVKTGQFTDAAAEKHLADVLIKRRDAIGRAYLATRQPGGRSGVERGRSAHVRERGGRTRARRRRPIRTWRSGPRSTTPPARRPASAKRPAAIDSRPRPACRVRQGPTSKWR